MPLRPGVRRLVSMRPSKAAVSSAKAQGLCASGQQSVDEALRMLQGAGEVSPLQCCSCSD